MDDPDVLQQRRQRIAEFATYCVKSGRGSLRPWIRRPSAALRTVRDVLALPVLTARTSHTAEGIAVRRGLQRARPSHTPVDRLVSVLLLPPTLEDYVQTPARRPVRRKVRVAQRANLTWAPVDHVARHDMIALADARERVHPDPVYRRAAPSNRDLLDHDLWLAAYDADGAPLMLVVIPVDGEWAVLRYFRTLAEGEQASVARYLMTEVLVGELIARGVKYLADSESPFVLPNGLRHFQRMVGYELFRLDLQPPIAASAPAAVDLRQRASATS